MRQPPSVLLTFTLYSTARERFAEALGHQRRAVGEGHARRDQPPAVDQLDAPAVAVVAAALLLFSSGWRTGDNDEPNSDGIANVMISTLETRLSLEPNDGGVADMDTENGKAS